VLEPYALCRRNGRERTDLIRHEIFDVGRRHLDFTSAEPLEVGKARVRTDSHTVFGGKRHGVAHDAGIPGVKSARDISGRNVTHERGLMPKIAASPLTNVSV
jgi:hypothetical protein